MRCFSLYRRSLSSQLTTTIFSALHIPASTCSVSNKTLTPISFPQLISRRFSDLPRYKSVGKLKYKLLQSIQMTQGFSLVWRKTSNKNLLFCWFLKKWNKNDWLKDELKVFQLRLHRWHSFFWITVARLTNFNFAFSRLSKQIFPKLATVNRSACFNSHFVVHVFHWFSILRFLKIWFFKCIFRRLPNVFSQTDSSERLVLPLRTIHSRQFRQFH